MKLKVGIVGYKNGGKAHYSELRRSDKFEVCGIFEEDGVDEYCRAQTYSDFKQFIENSKPQVLVLCLDENDVFKAYCECIKHCKNILISRPICKTQDELSQMKYLSLKNETKTALCLSSRFNPVILSLLKALKKDDEIFSIEIFNSTNKKDANIINELTLCDIDLAKLIANSDIHELDCSFTNRANSKSSDNAMIKIKFKNQILASITNSLTSQLNRHFVVVNATSGAYFADLIGLKLHQLNESGQINLKVNSEISELKVLYDEFFGLIYNAKNDTIALLDDAIKIRGFIS
ncbi:Gfo/Idh/MocA family oxidoreductase [Campylobacter mucosalis]|uniref:Gfo/Idh/MocA family oxidoreductase n=1 Tax=Campylobacter mucosalis TaxID=202 RepID=UPI0004DB1188|nr:Gfo/Idh/MocA family oxidoreductase [Campylobacter mucosalis]KEA45744.1 oxidoreductase [Campylobacter mucosalis]QKF63388.1 oxidoreductase, Gfo/Idh/MocA family [Campylobacter mucosalis]